MAFDPIAGAVDVVPGEGGLSGVEVGAQEPDLAALGLGVGDAGGDDLDEVVSPAQEALGEAHGCGAPDRLGELVGLGLLDEVEFEGDLGDAFDGAVDGVVVVGIGAMGGVGAVGAEGPAADVGGIVLGEDEAGERA